MSIIEFPYTFHKGYLMPIIPITIQDHRTWVFVDSGATFTILNVDDAFNHFQVCFNDHIRKVTFQKI